MSFNKELRSRIFRSLSAGMASESARQFNVAPQDKDKIDSLIHDFSDKNDEDDWESDDDSNETENEKVDVHFAPTHLPVSRGV